MTANFAIRPAAWISVILLSAATSLSALLRAEEPSEPLDAADVQFFETRIRPVLVKQCYECHAGNSKIIRGGLQVDSREALRKGGDSGLAPQDYYALAGIFYSTQSMADRAFVSKWLERPRPSQAIEAKRAPFLARVEAAKAQLQQMKDARANATEPISDEDLKKQENVVEALVKEMPAFEMVMAVQEGTPRDLPVHIRGNHLTLSPDVVPRAMPAILTSVHAAPVIGTETSGRLELARWLVSPEHPLTARVMANRIWMWHFGTALMRNPSNFGLQAEEPTHPELLDWLARELIRRDWSLKEMHRLIMLSAMYQMSSQPVADDEVRDPENRLWRRQNRRRLEAEPVRDSVLFVGGELDLALGNIASGTDANRRAIYLPINRSAFYEMFSTFDYVETANHIEQRPTTTIPQQALFLMNSPLVIRQAENLAKDLLQQRSDDSSMSDRQLISRAFERLYSRLPVDSELNRAERFLKDADATLPPGDDALPNALQSLQLDLLRDLDRLKRPGLRTSADAELDARIESFELAFRMQTEAPEVLDISRESESTYKLYGIDGGPTDGFGRQCLLARRLSESGVRFVQVTHGYWDQHAQLKEKHAELAKEVDLPIAGLLTDLKKRGLLEDTLLMWGAEFGRTPTAQKKDGRDHNPHAFTYWMAGGGVKAGFSYGESDDFGFYAAHDKVHVHDLHATILHLLGIDHERLTYRYGGRDFRLTDVEGRVVDEIFA